MAHILADRVKETTTTTGTGALALGGAVTGFRDFDSVMANADTTLYAIFSSGGSEWEVGIGTWNTGNTLSRTTILASSNAGAVVNLSAGTKTVALTLTTAGIWPGLLLAEGAAINWDSGDVTLTQSGNTLTLAGGGFVLPAGTTAQAPLTFDSSGSLVTTAVDNTMEVDATNLYFTSDAGNRGYVSVNHFTRLAANRNLTNDTNENPLFASADDAITLETGVYRFEMILRITTMSSTSGNALIDILGAGTAVVDTWAWWYNAVDNSSPSPGPVTAQSGWPFQQDSAASIATAGTGTALAVAAWGTFDVTTGGTLIPSIDLVTANAAVLSAGSYFKVERMGATDVVKLGQWA